MLLLVPFKVSSQPTRVMIASDAGEMNSITTLIQHFPAVAVVLMQWKTPIQKVASSSIFTAAGAQPTLVSTLSSQDQELLDHRGCTRLHVASVSSCDHVTTIPCVCACVQGNPVRRPAACQDQRARGCAEVGHQSSSRCSGMLPPGKCGNISDGRGADAGLQKDTSAIHA